MGLSSILSSMLWCCILVYVIDRKWLHASLACCVTAIFAAFMIIHQPRVSPNPNPNPDPNLSRQSTLAALTLTRTLSPTFCATNPSPDS
jgi:hypothetical protein